MNTQFIVHPKLQHYGLTTSNLDAMVDWYRKVLGMSIHHRAAVPAGVRDRAPFSGAAFISNDEVHHRMVFFEMPNLVSDPDQNIVEINVNAYGDEWEATEHMRTAPLFARVYVDPDKMVAARKAGASPWELHERAVAGEFAPAQPYDPRRSF